MVESILVVLFLARLLIGTVILSYASLRDWKTRTVTDWAWALMGTAGLMLFGIEVITSTPDIRTYLILVPLGLMFLDLMWDREASQLGRLSTLLIYLASALSVVLLLARFTTFETVAQGILGRGLGALFVLLLAYLLYYVGLIKGGADAKALVATALLVPGYPEWGGLPLLPLDPRVLGAFNVFFPFALSTLMNAALLLLFLPPYFLVLNVLRGDFRWPQALLGYKAPLDRLPRFSWVLQEASSGGVRYHTFPRKKAEEADVHGLRDLGIERVWITPGIPFLIPLAVSFVVTMLVGNLLLALF